MGIGAEILWGGWGKRMQKAPFLKHRCGALRALWVMKFCFLDTELQFFLWGSLIFLLLQ